MQLLLCWYWWVLFKLRNCGIHFVPRLGVRNENVHLRLKPTRVIQRASENSDERRIASFKLASRKSRPAFGTKAAFVFSTPDTRREMVTQLPAGESKCLPRYQHAGRKA